MKRSSLLSILLLACGVFFPADTSGYNYATEWDGSIIRWSNASTNLYASAVSFPEGNACRTALNDIVARFNLNPSPLVINLHHGDTDLRKGNNQSEIWFSGSTSDAPAVTYSYYSGSTLWVFDYSLDEADIAIYRNEGWTLSRRPSANSQYGGGSRTFHTTVLHEIGHFTGLKHVSNLYNIMGTDFTFIHRNGNQTTEYLGEDATNGLVFLYGSQSGIEDLSIVHWKYAGYSNGEYSAHNRTVIRNAANAVLTGHTYNGGTEPRYEVQAGQTIYPQFTVENNGYTSPLSVVIDYYLSTDTTINLSDRWIKRLPSYTISRDTPDTMTAEVVIPSDVATGDYYIGAIVDDFQAVDEYDENNNATYIGIHVTNNTPPTPTDTPVILPTPTYRPKETPTPTPGKKPPLPFENIFVINPILELQAGDFKQSTTILKQTINVTYTDGLKEPFLAEYQIGQGYSMDPVNSISLPDGSLLVSARKSGATIPTLCAILSSGDMVEFANVQIPEIAIDNKTMNVFMLTLLGMSYDGNDKVNLLLRASGGDPDQTQYFDAILRTEIQGPFKNTGLWDFILH